LCDDLGVYLALGYLFRYIVLDGLENDSERSCDFLEHYFVKSYALLHIFVPDLVVDLLAAEKHVDGKALLHFVQARGKLFESAVQEVVQDVPCVRVFFH
jgi:hypothetical protein